MSKRNNEKPLKDLIGVNANDYTLVDPESVGIKDVSWLDGRYLKILYMAVQGYTNRDIAKEVGINEFEISKIRNSEEFSILRDYLISEIVKACRTFLTVGAVKAVKTIFDCLDSSEDRVRLGAAKDILDRSGLKSPEKIEITNKGENLADMTTEQLAELVMAGQKEIYNVLYGNKTKEQLTDGELEDDEADESSD